MMCEAVLARRNAGPWSVAPESVILGCRRVWGEATRDSAPFYERQLGRNVADSFFLSAEDHSTGVLGNRGSAFKPRPKPMRSAASLTTKRPADARRHGHT